MLKILASQTVVLNSNVHTGGGTDVTKELQAVLDMAPQNGGVHLVMDGAALVSGLKIYSDTIIECKNADCGFFMKDYANRPILSNYNWSFDEITTKNVTLIGGTYNHNCTKQAHHVSTEEFPFPKSQKTNTYAPGHAVYLMEFYGVEGFKAEGVTYKNQRTYAFTLGNFKNAVLNNCRVDMAEHVHPSNQDGFHFFGPGQNLKMTNLRGTTGDDFINLAPDEMDLESDITDVLIDGVIFDDVCQGIRMLSRHNGRLDRVTVRNVSGTYRTFAFSIMPFFKNDNLGNFGNILIENINLKQIKETYHYTPLSFMELGGNVESLTLKNVCFENPVRTSLFIDLGRPFFYRPKELTADEAEKYCITDADSLPEDNYIITDGKKPLIKNFTLDGAVFKSDNKTDNMDYISLKNNIGNLTFKNINIYRTDSAKTSGSFVKMTESSRVDKINFENIYAEKIESLFIPNKQNNVGILNMVNVEIKG